MVGFKELERRVLALHDRINKAKKSGGKGGWQSQPRHPAGSKQGGQFAAKGSSSSGGQGKSTTWQQSYWNGPMKPVQPPKGAKPHPQANDDGQEVTINKPTRPSPARSWNNANATATWAPGSAAPSMLNGVKMESWTPPSDWSKLPSNPAFEADLPTPKPGQSIGAGVIVLEDDGRVWLTEPTNHFGGYQATFPKGTMEHGLNLQQSAVKEAWEETGLHVEITGVLGDYQRTTSVARMFVARRVGGTPSDMGWESQGVRLAPLQRARKIMNREHDRSILDDFVDEIGLGEEDSRPFLKAKGAAAKKSGHWTKQPRWPKGSALGGQWKTTDADGVTEPPTIAGGLTSANPSYQKKVNAAYSAAKKGDLAAIQVVVNGVSDADAKWSSGAKVNSHVKWKAQVYQYGKQLLGDVQAGTKATAAAKKVSGPLGLDAMKFQQKKPGGSNPGGIYTASIAGEDKTVLVKGNLQFTNGSVNKATSDNRAKNEVLAAELMKIAGAGGVNMHLVDLKGQYGGGLGVAGEMIDGLKDMSPNNKAHVQAAQQDFAVHAWLANYDALGLGYDNTMIDANGKAVCIDPGGALLFRAQGLPKGPGKDGLSLLDSSAPEFESMRNTTSQQQQVYGSMSAGQLKASASGLQQITDDAIKALVEAHGPGDAEFRAALAQNLIDRRDAILAKVGLKADPANTGSSQQEAAKEKATKPKVVPVKPFAGGGELEKKMADAASYAASSTDPFDTALMLVNVARGGMKSGIGNDVAAELLAQYAAKAGATLAASGDAYLYNNATGSKTAEKAEAMSAAAPGDMAAQMAAFKALSSQLVKDKKPAGVLGAAVNIAQRMMEIGAAEKVAPATAEKVSGPVEAAIASLVATAEHAKVQSGTAIAPPTIMTIASGDMVSAVVQAGLAGASGPEVASLAERAAAMLSAISAEVDADVSVVAGGPPTSTGVGKAAIDSIIAANGNLEKVSAIIADVAAGLSKSEGTTTGNLKADAAIVVGYGIAVMAGSVDGQQTTKAPTAAEMKAKMLGAVKGSGSAEQAIEAVSSAMIEAVAAGGVSPTEASQAAFSAAMATATKLANEGKTHVAPAWKTGSTPGVDLSAQSIKEAVGNISTQQNYLSGFLEATADKPAGTTLGDIKGDLVGHGFSTMVETASQAMVAAGMLKAQANVPKAPPEKPSFVAPGDFKQAKNAVKFYEKMADQFESLAAAGDLAALEEAATGGKYAGGVPWKPTSVNGKKMAAYHAALVEHLSGTQAAETLGAAQVANASVTSPRKVPGAEEAKAAGLPAMPDFAAAKVPDTNSNAKSHNPKVDTIQALAAEGDEKGLLSLNYGTNTYGKKQAKLANDALAAMGSPHEVTPGQKKHAHPALFGGQDQAKVSDAAEKLGAAMPPESEAPAKAAAAQKESVSTGKWPSLEAGETLLEKGETFGVKWAKIQTPAKGFTPGDIEQPPDFFNNGTLGPTNKWKSSVEHVNADNNAAGKLIYDTAVSGKGASAVEGLKIPAIDKATGEPTGKNWSIKDHPAAEVKQYGAQVVAELKAQERPGIKTVHSGSFTSSYASASATMAEKHKLIAAKKFASATRAADYVVLSKDGATHVPPPPEGSFKNWTPQQKSYQEFKDHTAEAFANLSSKQRSDLVAYTGNAYTNWNSALRNGEVESSHYKAAQPMVKAFKTAAKDLPGGITLWRGIGVGGATFQSVEGAVLQDGSFNSASYGDKPGGAFYHHNTWLRIHVPGPGVKAINATTFSSFQSTEREIILQNNIRYAVTKVTEHANFNGHGHKFIVDVIALPHEDGED